MSDIYSAMTSAIGTLKGPLHGGANMEVMRMFEQIGDAEKAESWVLEKLEGNVKIPGFGHRVYRCEDPRVKILREYAGRITSKKGNSMLFEIALAVEKTMLAHSKVFPNVDFYTAPLYHGMGIPLELFTPIFAISRTVGWTAHVLEQWSNNKLIRPRAEYTGPLSLEYVDIENRTY
jgi:citrate synthase